MQGTKGRSLLRSTAFGWRLWTFVLAYLLVFTGSVTADPGVNATAPFSFSGTNGCVVPAEDFVGTGALHMVVTSNLSAGGMVQSHLKANLQGMQATALVSLKKYQVIDSETDSYEFDFSDVTPFHNTWEFMVQFIRVGEGGVYVMGDDFFLHFLAHATVNANGFVTVDDFTTDTGCR